MLETGFGVFLLFTSMSRLTALPSLFFLLFFLYLFSLWVNKKTNTGVDGLVVILAFAVVFRLTLLFSGPVFSFDFFRYIWDGKVGSSGINPYLYPPDSTRLSALRDANWELINHKYLRTGYPPLMEMLFEVLYLTFRTAISYKATFFFFDLATVATVCLMLSQMKLSLSNAMIYAWAPLPIVEVIQTGHNDSVAVFLVLLSLLFLLRRQNRSSAAVMALAVLAKLYPIFFAPILLRRWGKQGTSIFLALIVSFHIPYTGIGLEIYRGLFYAINTANFNGSIFPFVTSLFEWIHASFNAGLASQIIVYAAYISLLVWALLRSNRKDYSASNLVKTTFLLTGAVLLLNRSFFPWYMTWIIPYLALYASPSWLLLSGTIFLGYMKYNSFPPPPYETVDPRIGLIITLVEYAPFYAILAYELLRHKFNFGAQLIDKSNVVRT
jgi:alpha-1,6-mannosyltransferase